MLPSRVIEDRLGVLCRRCVVGSVDIDCGSQLYSDLIKAQQSLVIANHLHLLYLATPYDMVTDIKPNWMIYIHEASLMLRLVENYFHLLLEMDL